MGLYRRGKVWWARVQVAGKETRCSTRTESRAEAKTFEATLRARLLGNARLGVLGLRPRHTLEEALDAWLEGEARTLRSARETKNHAAHVRPYLKGKWLEDGPEVANTIKKASRHLKPATTNQRLAVLRRILALAYQWSWISEPLAGRVTLLRLDNARHLYLTPAEVESLATASGEAQGAILLLAYSGLRLSELYRAKRVTAGDRAMLILDNTKSGKPRAVPLPPEVADLPCPPAVTVAQLRRRFNRARKAIGRPEIRIHDLRHTYASWLVQGGASPVQVRDLLGHSSLSVTGRYSHLSRDDLWAAIARLPGTKAGTDGGADRS